MTGCSALENEEDQGNDGNSVLKRRPWQYPNGGRKFWKEIIVGNPGLLAPWSWWL